MEKHMANLVTANTEYVNISNGSDLVVFDPKDAIRVVFSETQPAANTANYLTYLEKGNLNQPLSLDVPYFTNMWIRSLSDEATADVVYQGTNRIVSLEDRLMTANNGPYSRLRVDQGEAGFWQGRQFRSVYDMNITQGTSVYIQANVNVNTILRGLTVDLVQGSIRVYTLAGATGAGTFSTPVPTFPQNSQSDVAAYTQQNTLLLGGTASGGTVIDVIHIKTDTNSNRSASVGGAALDDRGVAPATYYYHIEVDAGDNAVGVLRARWEERPTPYL